MFSRAAERAITPQGQNAAARELPEPQPDAVWGEADALLEFPAEAASISRERSGDRTADAGLPHLLLPTEFLSEEDLVAPAQPAHLPPAQSPQHMQRGFLVALEAITTLRGPLLAGWLWLVAFAQSVRLFISDRLVVAHGIWRSALTAARNNAQAWRARIREALAHASAVPRVAGIAGVVPFACGILVGGTAALVIAGALGARAVPRYLPDASAAQQPPASYERSATAPPLRYVSASGPASRLPQWSVLVRASSRLNDSAQGPLGDRPIPENAGVSRQPRVFHGSLTIESRPQGATVYLNALAVGTTPITLPTLQVGSRAVRLELEGYQRWSTAVQVVAGQPARVTATLVQVPD